MTRRRARPNPLAVCTVDVLKIERRYGLGIANFLRQMTAEELDGVDPGPPTRSDFAIWVGDPAGWQQRRPRCCGPSRPLGPSETDTEIAQRVEEGLRVLSVDPKTTAPYLLRLLTGDSENTNQPLAKLPELPPEVLKRRTFEALQRITLAGAKLRPVVLAFEDLHWADKTTEEVATFLLDHIAGAQVLLLFTYRPEFVSDWSRKSYHSAITLARMSICYQSLGDAYFSSGRLQLAIESLAKALRIAEEANNAAGVAAACTFLSNAYARAGNLTEAILYGRRALLFGEQLHDDRRIAWACLMLTQGLIQAGELSEAEALVERANKLFDKVGDFRGLSWVLQWRGWMLQVTGTNFEEAFHYRDRGAQMAEESGGFRDEMTAGLARAALNLLRLGRYQEAFEYCHRCLAISLKASNKLIYGIAYRVLTEVHASDAYRDWGKAEWYLGESLKAFREVGAELNVGETHLAGARIALLRHDRTVRRWAETARDIFAKCGAKPYLRDAEELLATLP